MDSMNRKKFKAELRRIASLADLPRKLEEAAFVVSKGLLSLGEDQDTKSLRRDMMDKVWLAQEKARTELEEHPFTFAFQKGIRELEAGEEALDLRNDPR